ncbi:conserved hypothetical protein [Trichormus variabilis ATCC 29413]|uniref:Uncharacterized protein n=2 Tax=Anabaena variabilis TaxID=264691 RepID=Q3MCK9_TRIV2|nr:MULTISPECIES: hypothetical protein [Nostocaceae]ABA21277.1 conserved hypothetical protein [Trichormus variabilis ATCC 29413]MBC1214240.1 hypothetical protein [Trichormus variabilis ARAD]MBC1254152.1 hypothetical protein [Trichormus variabilis V5]MBC1266344.1 hypothetical protein [Trichormus variabilis FSR]MBC1301040.1 hypothetical protein [Trichormus variabilis N2B]
MQITSPSTQINLETVFERIFTIGRISRRDQQLLMSTLLSKEGLSEGEQQQISRVFTALQNGLLKVVD